MILLSDIKMLTILYSLCVWAINTGHEFLIICLNELRHLSGTKRNSLVDPFSMPWICLGSPEHYDSEEVKIIIKDQHMLQTLLGLGMLGIYHDFLVNAKIIIKACQVVPSKKDSVIHLHNCTKYAQINVKTLNRTFSLH